MAGPAKDLLTQGEPANVVGQATASGLRTITAEDALERAVVYRINQTRAGRGLRRLSVVSSLTSAATRHANSMAKYGYFDHDHDLFTPQRAIDWTPFDTWIRWYYPGPGYSSWDAGENLVYGTPDIAAAEVIRRWLASPPHRKNLLNPVWRNVGVAAVHVTNPTGQFAKTVEVTLVVADFGRRS